MAKKEDEKKWLETFLETRNQSETSRRHGVPQSTLNKFLQSIPDLNKELPIIGNYCYLNAT